LFGRNEILVRVVVELHC